jgi:hypothetical protein
LEKKTYQLFQTGKLMPWGMGTSVKDAKGFVFLAGTVGRDPGMPPKGSPVVMLHWNLKNGGRYGKEDTLSRKDH